MNTNAILKTFRWAGFFFVVTMFVACSDDLNEVGLEISPGSNLLIFHDSTTTKLNSYTIAMEDTIRTTNVSNLIAGYIMDPKVGVFQNNFMAEVKTLGKAYTFGKNPVADSVVLFLHYNSINGDTLTSQTLAFYELNLKKELARINGMPNSDDVVNQFYDPDKFLTNITFTPTKKDSVYRIKLPQSLAERLIDSINVNYYDTVSKFNYYVFRGIYAMAKPLAHGGGTCNFSFSDSTFIKLFYRNDTAIKLDTFFTYNYYINSSTTKCNLFKRSFNEGNKVFPLDWKPDPAQQQDLCYVRGFNGAETRIDISGIKTWADSGYYVFNKAILTVYPDYTNNDEKKVYPPTRLDIYRIDTASTKKIVADYYNSSTGGSASVGYDTAKNAYDVILTQQLYNTIKEGKDTLTIVLTPQNNRTEPNRMILRGVTNSESPMKLRITYTKINSN